MGETEQNLGVTLEYPVLGSDTFYSLLPKLNEEFNLELSEDDYIDNLAHVGLDGYITIAGIDKSNNLKYLFKNTSYEESKVISKWFTPNFPVVENAACFINFEREISFLNNFDLDTPIPYNYVNTPYFRVLKHLLFFYGYGNYPIIGDGREIALSGMKVIYYGSGLGLADTYPSLVDCQTVAIISLPSKDGWHDVIIKTERVI